MFEDKKVNAIFTIAGIAGVVATILAFSLSSASPTTNEELQASTTVSQDNPDAKTTTSFEAKVSDEETSVKIERTEEYEVSDDLEKSIDAANEVASELSKLSGNIANEVNKVVE